MEKHLMTGLKCTESFSPKFRLFIVFIFMVLEVYICNTEEWFLLWGSDTYK